MRRKVLELEQADAIPEKPGTSGTKVYVQGQDMAEIKKFIDGYRKLLPLEQSISGPEAERRASKFLQAMAAVADWKHVLTERKIKELSIQTAVYATQLSRGTGKTVTENKTTAEASPEFIAAREALENTDNDIAYLRTYYEIFNNAHVFFRQVSKGDTSFG